MAADTAKHWSIREDGFLSVDTNVDRLTYNSSLNSIIITCKDQTVTVLDALSGAFLQKSDLSGHKKGRIECAYLPEKDKTVFCDGLALGVRGDLQGILLLDTALQTAVSKTEDFVKIELPLAEATHLLKTLASTDLRTKDNVDDFEKVLGQGIHKAEAATQGNHKTAKWATVTLQMQHMAIRSVCSALMEELTKSNQTGQGFPVASAIVDRLGFLLPSSRLDIMKEPVNRALMYSEAARRETFANWPHMNYKWALPEPMAQAGFFHHPNLHGDDRAMCFTCNVCLVCWEPTDEPWSEHERHSQLCPYIKGDYTQNVPLTVTYATQPAQCHDDQEQQKIACLSTTLNEDFIATSTTSGNITVWDISYILKKHCQFDIDLGNALVALTTGLHIENSDLENDQVPSRNQAENSETSENLAEDKCSRDKPSTQGPHRPSLDLCVTSLCVADETKWREEGLSPNPSKPVSPGSAQLSLFCGVTLRCAKPPGMLRSKDCKGFSSRKNETVQLMNEVNEAVSGDSPSISELITESSLSSKSEFLVPHGRLAPYIVVVSLVEEKSASCQSSPLKKSIPPITKPSTNKDDMAVPVGEHSNSMDYWSVNSWEDGLDPDCQIVGFSPPPGKSPSSSFLGMMMEGAKYIQELHKNDVPNGPSDLCDSVDTIPEPSSPDKRFFFCDYPDAGLSAPGKEPSVTSFHNIASSGANSGSSIPVTNEFPNKVQVNFSGAVIQCLELPCEFQKEQIEVQSILPSIDKQHVILILSMKVGFLESTNFSILAPDASSSNALAPDFCGGGILVYRLRSENCRLVLEDVPVLTYQVSSPKDVITSTFLLPPEVEDQVEDGGLSQSPDNQGLPCVTGHLVLTTASGVLKIMSLAKLSTVAEISPGPSEKYICATYCSGVERLSACTDNGKLKFFDLDTVNNRRCSWNSPDPIDGLLLNGEASACKKAKMDEDVVDHSGPDYLINQPLNGVTLKQLHQLIQFENLMPRFTAVVPPCWSEIQQEQQQRRHPQHLQQQGESTQHTRTWKLTTDASGQTWDEHLFEILLPKPCSVGHVDIKFSLHPMCTLQPNVEITLLKQNIGSIFCPPNHNPGVKDGQNNNLKEGQQKGAAANCDSVQDPDEPVILNTVLDPKFLKTHNAEILCGPVKLANCLDLTGSGGLITLSSPQLLSSKPRSLLLHIKGFENSPVSDPILINKEKAETDRSSTLDKKMKFKKKTLKGLFDSVAQGSAEKNSAAERQKLTDVKGCDWFQELSVTVRVFKKTNVKAEKQQRHSMITDNGFHKRLIELLTPSNQCVIKGVSPDHLHCMALDILIWALAVQMNDVEKRCEKPMLEAIQSELKSMVKTCFILGSRTTAHKFSRLLAMCMESSKYSLDRDVAPAFSYAVMQALLACYPLLPHCSSSGALRWFFILLNRAKCMDVEMVAQKSCELLLQVSKHYYKRTHHLQALLKTRYGLYGNPFEAELFDLEHSNVTKPQAALSGTTPGAIFTNGLKGPSNSGNGSSAGSKDQTDLFDLLTSEKNFKTQPDCLRSDILGLLEVEPLHFRCHATSDGTRMERMDASSTLHGAVAASTFNTGLSQLALQGFGVEDMPGDLCSYMAAKKLDPPLPQIPPPIQPPLMLSDDIMLKKKSHLHSSKMYGGTKLLKPEHNTLTTEPQVQKTKSQPQTKSAASKAFAFPQMQGLLQSPPPQVLVIERMHSGARRFVTLDFGKRIVLTDVVIPSSMDLASLSIDVWVEKEEVDGQRLVVASDIGHRTLVMNNIMPAPVCRYLKITTVGRYSGGTTRSRIPLGSFYGHTYILPWELPNLSASSFSAAKNQNGPSFSAKDSVKAERGEASKEAKETGKINSEGGNSCEMTSHSGLLSQLALFLSLLEDLQCRFNLARTRLESLLTVVGNAQFLSSHVQYHLKRNTSGKLNEEDAQIIQAYNECLQLQVQLNLAQHAIRRLQTSLGLCVDVIDESVSPDVMLEQTSTDKLRVILESLLDTLLTSTVGSPAIPQPPAALYTALTPVAAQTLFQHLCIHSPQRVQVSAGLLLVRVCGTQPWWGHFLGNIMQEFFHAHFSQVFPQDRVFLLLSAMGQKSLCGPSAVQILDSLLAMLSTILSPLTRSPETDASALPAGNLDLSLISWVLLFLCRNMEGSSTLSNADDGEKNGKRDKEGGMFNNRWGFIESQWSSSGTGAHGKSQRVYRRGLQKRVALYKEKLDKMKILSGSDKKNLFNSKYTLKRNQLLIKLANDKTRGEASHDAEDDELEVEPLIMLSRERCLSVARGLMALLLSMDFTCHVDLFLITCKVLAKICVACRPSVSLTEAMTQEQLEQLVLLVVDTEFNHNSMSWGGPWAAHAITCLLQDILEGKKSGSSSPEGSETELADADDSLVYARWMEREGSMLCTEHVQDNKKVRVIPYENVRSILRNKPEFHEFVKRDFLDGTFCLDEKDNPAALVLLILNKNDKDKVRWNKFLETVTKNQAKGIHQAKPGTSLDVHKDIQNFIMDCFSYPLPSDFSIESFMYDSPGSSVASGSSNWVDALKIAQSKSIQSGSLKHLLNLKNKLTEHMAAASGISLHLSTALDARLEFGLETMPEHRLKMMQSVQLGNVHCAFTLPLPQCPAGSVQSFDENHVQTSMAEEMAEREQSLSSVEMLSTCFEHMFARLRSGRVSLESVLQLWLTLNEDHLPNEEGGASSSASASSRVQHFDATRQPIITLSENAVASLIEVGVMMPSLMIRTWVFLLQSLCLLTNQRHISSQGVEVSLAPAVLRDANLAPLITKFLCSHPPGGSGSAGSQLYQVGPAAVKILGHLLHRLQCKSIEVNGQRFKEMLLKIVYNLIADRGAIYQCSGPIDAQVQFLEMMSESPLLSVDVSNALSVIQAASTLVYQHLSSQDQVVCHTSHDTSLGAQSCFGGLVASLLRGNDSRPGGTDSLRDQLMFFLLQLVNKLISAPMNSMIRSGGKSSGGECSSGDNINHKSANRKPTWADPPIEGNRYTPRLLTNIRLSDDEKSRTRNQQGSDFQSQDQQQHQDREAEEEDEGQHTVSEIADIVAGHPVIMQNLIQSLSHCTSNKLALMFAHTDCLNSLQKSVDHTEAVTVGDLIFTILRNLKEKCSDRNVMVDNLYHFFAEHPSVMSQLALTRLSEPLLFYTLRILNSSSAIKRFIALGGVNVVGSNLVRCSQQMISSSPSIISTLMQNFSSGHTDLGDKNKGLEVDNTDGLQSFAQLGTITCSSPTAVPADGLIQMVASRRARSATWSYHFYPDEPSVELTIQLPFAVLLKYVHIKPHAAAISSCPSHVSLELSHDGNVVTPTSPPLLTSSLTLIRLQLQKPQVVTSVTLLLHRPLDSTTIGLQRISLWGQTAFAESAESPLSIEDGFSRSSLGWMRILHHCLLNSNDELQNAVAQTAAQTPNLMSTCTSLLLHPVIGLHAAKIETILVRLGLSHKDISLTLLDNILRQPSNPSIHPVVAPAMSYLGKVHGIASPYTVEIIYRLGTTQDENTHERVAALLHWLEDCARSSLTQAQDVHPARNGNRSFGSYSVGLGDNTLCNPSPEHVQCIAAVLWYSMELPVTYPLHRLVNVDSIRLLFDWSRLLQEGNLRKAVNNVLCSACYICPNGFMHIQEWMGIVGADGSQIVAPTDNEESSEQREAMSPGRMTDDSKEATKLPTSSPLLYSTDGMTDDSKEARRLQSFSTMNLDESKLMMLSAVCKSPAAIRQLMTSGLPAMLAQAVCEFCNQQMLLMASLGCAAEGLLGGDTTSLTGIVSESSITATLVSAILRFFTEISSETELKDWLGHAEGNAFWSLLLTLLCGSQYQAPAILNSPNSEALGLLNAEERSVLETKTIQFFSTVIAFHTENQLLFAKVLCDVIKDQGTSKSDLASAMPLSGFMRRLLLQVLLEDEKITVAVRNTSSKLPNEDDDDLTDAVTEGTESFPLASCSGQIFHPRYGSGRGCQCVTMNLNSKCSDVIAKVADTLPLSSGGSDKKDDKKKRTDEASAKEKREKSPGSTTTATTSSGLPPKPPTSGLPPRPPTRRGRLTQGSDSLMDSMGNLRMPQALYRARLRHIALPGKDLPHNLSLSQLLHVLSDYALLPPTLALQFIVRYRTPGSIPFKAHTIASDKILLSEAPFPSALKMFASVGGLALLAEHLPLLFPEISRQSNNVEVVSDASSMCDIGADWVTVESSDEFYDPYLEPVTPPHVNKPNKNLANDGAVPSIPPHSLIAFGLFLRLPGYADVLLKERKIAQCLLRLVLGVTDDGDGGQILTSPAASSLPTMPFTVLKTLFDASPLTTDDGVLLRRMALDIGVVHLVLACLATLSHHKPRAPLTSFQHETQLILTAMQSSSAMASLSQPEEKSQQHYWAKGTGFGTGSTTSSWNAEQAMLRQKGEEEHVACLLQVLASYMNPCNTFETSKPATMTSSASARLSGGSVVTAALSISDSDSSTTPPSSPSSGDPINVADSSTSGQPNNHNAIPDSLVELLAQSCLVPALSSYLRNDSVLDMARHVPLYRALLQLLRGITSNPALVPILLPMEVAGHGGLGMDKINDGCVEGGVESQACIETLLEKMKGCVDTYASRLKSNKGKSANKMEDEESEGLALLIPDIQETARLVRLATQRLKEMNEQNEKQNQQVNEAQSAKPQQTLEHKYLSAMKDLQFDTYEMVTEEGKTFKFHVSHHYESNVKATGTVSNVARTRRLAQEAVTLSTSLPLAFSSSVFVRCDEERLDVMKVLITGPSDTPYANGCFEFDVFFPHDYPNTPPFINMETTGNHSVRFNPNLYNDGKVCLSILNTWHGRPEEKWNAQTSSFLQVLVSIQSLILVSEPYFNEPGYERSRGTPPGQASSHEYDANIRQATVKWAMLEQLKNPSPCFKEIIHTHFWFKRNEILKQCETWMTEMEGYSNDKRTGRSIAQSTLALKRHYNQLREELAKLKPPLDLDEEEEEVEAADASSAVAQSASCEEREGKLLAESEQLEQDKGATAVAKPLNNESLIKDNLFSEELSAEIEAIFETDSAEEDAHDMYLDGGPLSIFNSSSLAPNQQFPTLPVFHDDMSFDTDPEC